MAKKWPERVLQQSFISIFHFQSEYIINLTWRRMKSYLIEILLKSSNLVLKLQLRYDKCLVKLRWLAVLDPFFLFLDRKTLISAEWQQQCGKGQYKKKICKDITDKMLIYTMRKILPKALDLLIFSIYSLNFSTWTFFFKMGKVQWTFLCPREFFCLGELS